MASPVPRLGTRAVGVEGPAYPIELRDEVDAYLDQLRFTAVPQCEGLQEAMRYTLLAGGKRIRPVLALATARTVGVDHRAMLPVAAAIELIHTCSLIHDDLPGMDDSDLRRGRPANHRRFGEGVSILAGDALIVEAFRLLLMVDAPPARLVRAAEVIAHAASANGIAGGQYIDLTGTATDEAAVMHLHRLKTGALLRACVHSVLALVDPPGRTCGALSDYAAELGLMFQIIDDILDVTATSAETGKPERCDARNGRNTVAGDGRAQHAIRLADECLARACAALAAMPGDTDELAAIAHHVRCSIPVTAE